MNIPTSLIVPKLSAAPGSPTAGQVYYDTTLNGLYVYNGTLWLPAGGGKTPTQQVLSTAGTGTYTTPAGCRAIYVECIGAGGGAPAAAINPTNAGLVPGGGGGAWAASYIANPAATYSYTVPSGGAGSNATTAGSAIFGSNVVVAAGGTSGTPLAASGFQVAPGGPGGVFTSPSVGTVTLPGSDGGSAYSFSATSVIAGFGGAAARGAGITKPATGTNPVGAVAGKNGGGGAAGGWVVTSGTCASAVGGNGLIIVTEFYY